MSGGQDAAATQRTVERALEAARRAGADAADCVLAQSDVVEARVRNTEIDFVKQAREHTLGIRALVRGAGGFRTALTSTSDLAPEAIDRMAGEAVALARATAEDPNAGILENGFATDSPDLSLFEPLDRDVSVEARIEDAKRAEAAARSEDPRIQNSEGSEVSSDFSRLAFGNSAGFFGTYESASHSLFSEPLARDNGSMQRDYWYTVARKLADLEDAEAVGRKAAQRALRRLGAVQIPTCEAPVIFDSVTAPSLLGHLVGCLSGYSIYRESSFLAGRLGLGPLSRAGAGRRELSRPADRSRRHSPGARSEGTGESACESESRSRIARSERQQNGIPMNDTTWEEILQAAEQVGMDRGQVESMLA